MSNDSKKETVKLTKPQLTQSAELTQPVLTNKDEVPEYKGNEPIVKVDLPKKSVTLTKTPKVVTIAPKSNGSTISFSSKSSPKTPVLEGTIADRAARFHRLALANNRASTKAGMETLAIELLGAEVVVLKGPGFNEIAFEIQGVRLPTEGFYFTK